jgi:hypothetical protein|tara:strand:- start:1430 stop:1810 length:381 start_codon:yes stop_codon:yes gene_type:complete
MNFFQVQNKLFYKKGGCGFLDEEGEKAFIPFLTNRWLSFYSKDTVPFINNTLNKFGSLFEDKQQLYRLWYHLIPKLGWKKIAYVKKTKKAKKDDELERNIRLVAKNNSLSTREVKRMMEFLESSSK